MRRPRTERGSGATRRAAVALHRAGAEGATWLGRPPSTESGSSCVELAPTVTGPESGGSKDSSRFGQEELECL